MDNEQFNIIIDDSIFVVTGTINGGESFFSFNIDGHAIEVKDAENGSLTALNPPSGVDIALVEQICDQIEKHHL